MSMQSPHLQNTSFRKLERGRIVLSKPSRDGSAVRVEPEAGQAFRVFIVDRDSMSSDLLAATLTRDGNCHASAVPCTDLLRRLATSHVDLVVIGADLNQRSINGFTLTRQVSSAYPGALIVMLLDESTQVSVVDAFRSGARGVFSRQRPVSEFLDCLEHVGKGFIWAAEQEAAFLLEAFRCIPAPDPAMVKNSLPLTTRELQVTRCAAKGKTNKAIASELGLSEHTVKNYLFRAFEKLGVSNRVELLLYLVVRGYAVESATADAETEVFPERTSA